MDRLLKKLKNLRIRLTDRIAALRKLSHDLVPVAISDKLLALDDCIGILETPGAVMDPHTVGFIGAEAEDCFKALGILEKKHLLSKPAMDDLFERTQKLEHHRREAFEMFVAWRRMALKSNSHLFEIRRGRDEIIEFMSNAERESAQARIRDTLAPAPASRIERRRHSRSEFDRELRLSMKGKNSPADKHGHGKKRAVA